MNENLIFNALVEFFEEDNWDFQWVEGMSVLSMGFSGLNGRWVCYAQAREPQQQVVFYSVLPINVPYDRRIEAAEFLTRANYGMIIGNFEMDYDDGEIRYKTSLDVDGIELAPSMLRQMIYANVIITDRYLKGIMRVIYGEIEPFDALAEIEGDDDFEFDDFDTADFFDEEDFEAFDEFDDDETDSSDGFTPFDDDGRWSPN